MPEKYEDQLNKRNRIAKHLEGDDFKAAKGIDADAAHKEMPTTVINRDLLLQDLLKVVYVTPMEPFLKEILRIRLTYPESAVQRFLGISYKHGVPLSVIFKMEEDGKAQVVEYLKRHTLQDAINEFNASQQKAAVEVKNNMASEKKLILPNDGDVLPDNITGNDKPIV